MIHTKSIILLLGFIGTAMIATTTGAAADAAAETGHLPTPYTAEDIRDAWVVGLTVDTRLETAKGESFSRTVVTQWTEEQAHMTDQPLDAGRQPSGDAASFQLTWVDLQNHARFPTEMATRKRVTWPTPLGSLEGWLYTVRHGDDDHAEFFFADDYPGPPVVYLRRTDGEVVMRAEIVARTVDAPQ